MLGRGLESLIPSSRNDDDKNDKPTDLGAQSDGIAVNAGAGVPADDAIKPQFAGDDFRSAMAERDFLRNEPPIATPAASTVPIAQKTDSAGADFPGQPKVSVKNPTSAVRGKQPQQTDSIFHIEVEKIKPNPAQPRKNFDEKALWELAHSIREFGFLQPLVVSKIEKETPTGVDVEYQLIAGHRRLLAAKLLGLQVVPAIIRNVDLEIEKLELAVVENIQREDLNSIERARAMAKLQDEFHMTQREVASKLGKSREVVANTVRLLDLPTYIQEALEKGQITESHGRFLLAVQDPGAQKRLFDDLVANRLTTRDLKNRVRMTKAGGAAPAEISPEMKMMEEKLSAEFGTPVKIERGENTGKITITFYSDEELQSILDKMGAGKD